VIDKRFSVNNLVVSAAQMQSIESNIFKMGMPVAALMEKAALLMAERIKQLYPSAQYQKVGIIIGSGHNGGDALVVARELYLSGYEVKVLALFDRAKELTSQHALYARNLGIIFVDRLEDLVDCQFLIDGIFGFGLTRSISGEIATVIDRINLFNLPIVSIDIPSGLHTDTGEVLGTAIKASLSLCLGLWKRAFFQDRALEYLGKIEKIDFGIRDLHLGAIESNCPLTRVLDRETARQFIPLPRPLITHKYLQGNLLLICGSRRYGGSSILAGLGARGSGAGMLSIAVPESLKSILIGHLPEAIIIGCPETESGAIDRLPEDLVETIDRFDTIACGAGLTKDARSILATILDIKKPLILDADALNILVDLGSITTLNKRQHPTILTPHLGEFERLFPNINNPDVDRIEAVRLAAKLSGAIVLLKGARTAITDRSGTVWLIGESTPALARGGSGDVLLGIIGGLLAQQKASDAMLTDMLGTVAAAAWWHAQSAILAATENTELGVDGSTLARYLSISIHKVLGRFDRTSPNTL
jgi:ADP-dependent NAD(P)H-hydrate dehydratase / NAD(P)H-hydrate epimerase